MKRFISIFLTLIMLFSMPLSSFAATSDYLYTPDQITATSEGFDSVLGYYYGTTYYTMHFNENDLDEVLSTYVSKSSYFSLTFNTELPVNTHSSSVEGIMYLLYGGLSDCSGLMLSSTHSTIGGAMRFTNSSPFFTNSSRLSSFLKDKGYSVNDQWYLYFDNVNGYDYTVYTISTTSAGEVVCTFSKLGSKVTCTNGTLTVGSGYLYSVVFDTLEQAESYMRYNTTDGMIRCFSSKTIPDIADIHYSSYNLTDASGNLVFATYTIDSVPGDEVDNQGLLSGIVGSINNLGKNIASFFNGLFESIKGLFVPDPAFMDGVADRIGSISGVNGVDPDNGNLISVVCGFGLKISDFLQQDFSDPPEFTVNFSNSDSKYLKFNEDVNVMDLSWFDRYRSLTDPFISCFLWVGFLWLLYKRLPSILAGSGMTGGGAD